MLTVYVCVCVCKGRYCPAGVAPRPPVEWVGTRQGAATPANPRHGKTLSWLPARLRVCVYACVRASLLACMRACFPCVSAFVRLFVCLFVCLFVLFVGLFVCLFVPLFVCVFVCLFVCLFCFAGFVVVFRLFGLFELERTLAWP